MTLLAGPRRACWSFVRGFAGCRRFGDSRCRFGLFLIRWLCPAAFFEPVTARVGLFLRDRLGGRHARLRRRLRRLRRRRARAGVSASAISIPKTSARSPAAMVFLPRDLPARGDGRAVDGARDQLQMINLAEQEQQLGLIVQTGADAVHHRGDMLAHAGPVGAGALHLDFSRLREQTFTALGHDIHDARREPSLQELDQRTDLARTLSS